MNIEKMVTDERPRCQEKIFVGQLGERSCKNLARHDHDDAERPTKCGFHRVAMVARRAIKAPAKRQLPLKKPGAKTDKRRRDDETLGPVITGVPKMIADLEEIVSTQPLILAEMVMGSRFEYDLFKTIWPIRNLLVRNQFLLRTLDSSARFLDAQARCERLEAQVRRFGWEPVE